MAVKGKNAKQVDTMARIVNAIDHFTFGPKEQQAFLEDLSTLVDDGVPANKGVEVIREISSGTTKKVAEHIMGKIAQGMPIAQGMAGWFPQHIIELVSAGESGGTLAQNMRVAAESLGQQKETLSSLAASLTYPLTVLIAGCGVLLYLNSSIFTQFQAIKPIEQWPAQGQTLVAMANGLQEWWWLVIVVIVGSIMAMSYVFNNYIGEGRKMLDSLFGFKIYRQLAAARFMETLGLLISNGVVFKQSLKILQGQANPYLAWHLMIMERRLSRGRGNIAEVLDTGMVDREDVVRLKAIADAKGFEHALVRLGKQSAERGVQTVRKLGKILGGILLALGALFAGFMVTGIYSVGSALS